MDDICQSICFISEPTEKNFIEFDIETTPNFVHRYNFGSLWANITCTLIDNSFIIAPRLRAG
jgi:hypothetical protein